MPDHFHALVCGRSTSSDLAEFLRVAKQRTAFHAQREFSVRLWQYSFFDRSLRDDEDLLDVIRYIVNNPIRAGLVERPGDYPFWGSAVYTRDEILQSFQCGRT